MLKNPTFKLIASIADKLLLDVYIVGGYVRDLILKRENKDIDILVVKRENYTYNQSIGLLLAQAVGNELKTKVTLFKTFGTAQLKYNDIDIEFVGARKESYINNSRNPIVNEGSLNDDLSRRDFTINAMALSLNYHNYGEIIDLFNGKSDLENKVIKTPLEPNITYSDDPLRMLRAIRFATQLNFTIEENSLQAIRINAERLSIITQERITDELNKIILAKTPSIGFKLLFNTQLLHQFFKEMVYLQGIETIDKWSHKDNFYHTLQVLDNTAIKSNDLWLRWAAILHDIAKPATKRFDPKVGWTFHGHEDKGARMVPKIFAKLKLPLNEKMKYVQKLVQLHLRPIVLSKEIVTDSAVRRLLFEAGDDIDDLMLLCEADITSKNEEKVKKYLNNFATVKLKLVEIEAKDHIRNWQPPIDGLEIMQLFNLPPGKEVGILKNALKEAILEGIIDNEKEKAITFLRNYK